jgi:hypothetical protein
VPRAAPGLTSLDLSENQIGDRGAEALAEALVVGAGHGGGGGGRWWGAELTSLDLHDNHIGEAGAAALLRSIARLGEGGAGAVALRTVDLQHNPAIRAATLAAVRRHLAGAAHGQQRRPPRSAGFVDRRAAGGGAASMDRGALAEGGGGIGAKEAWVRAAVRY